MAKTLCCQCRGGPGLILGQETRSYMLQLRVCMLWLKILHGKKKEPACCRWRLKIWSAATRTWCSRINKYTIRKKKKHCWHFGVTFNFEIISKLLESCKNRTEQGIPIYPFPRFTNSTFCPITTIIFPPCFPVNKDILIHTYNLSKLGNLTNSRTSFHIQIPEFLIGFLELPPLPAERWPQTEFCVVSHFLLDWI